jgi:hypothetical protein
MISTKCALLSQVSLASLEVLDPSHWMANEGPAIFLERYFLID